MRMSSYAKFFPTAPLEIQQKHKKAAQERQRTKSKPPDTLPTITPYIEAVAQPSPCDGLPLEANAVNHGNLGSVAPEYTPAAQDDNESVSGDLLNGVGSASSNTSTVSSVFSATNQAAVLSSCNGRPNSYTMTPLTNTDSSPPEKVSSPPPKQFPITSRPDTGSTLLQPYPSPGKPPSGTATPRGDLSPAHLQARPLGRTVKGCKIIYDPEHDKKLSSREKRKQEAIYEDFGEEV